MTPSRCSLLLRIMALPCVCADTPAWGKALSAPRNQQGTKWEEIGCMSLKYRSNLAHFGTSLANWWLWLIVHPIQQHWDWDFCLFILRFFGLFYKPHTISAKPTANTIGCHFISGEFNPWICPWFECMIVLRCHRVADVRSEHLAGFEAFAWEKKGRH